MEHDRFCGRCGGQLGEDGMSSAWKGSELSALIGERARLADLLDDHGQWMADFNLYQTNPPGLLNALLTPLRSRIEELEAQLKGKDRQ